MEPDGIARSFQYSGGTGADDAAWRVDLALGPSPIASAAITMAGAATLGVVLASALPWFAHAALAAAVAVATVRALRRHGGREGAGAVRRVVVDLTGRIEVHGANGAIVSGEVAAGSFVAPWLTIVRWIPQGSRFARTVLVLPDTADAHAFRRLRVLLRCGIIPP